MKKEIDILLAITKFKFTYGDFKKLPYLLLGILLTAIVIKYFLMPLQIIAGGVLGISLIFSQFFSVQGEGNFWVLNLVFQLINIPLLFWGFFKVGKKLTIYTLFFTFSFPLIMSILPDYVVMDPIKNKLFMTILAGILLGLALGWVFESGGSSGGTDFVSVYMVKWKNRSIGKINSIIAWIIIVCGSVILGLKFNRGIINETLFYTLLMVSVEGVTLNKIYPRHKKVKVSIVTKDIKGISVLLRNGFNHRSFSLVPIFGSRGGKLTKIEIVLVYHEYLALQKELIYAHPDVFAYSEPITASIGRFNVRKL